MSNNTYSASGGSGAGYHAKIVITEGGYYTLTVGSGGLGKGSGKGGSPSADEGETTIFAKQDGTILLSAGGGTGGRSGPVWATAGTGGVLSKNVIESTVYTSTNGNNGNSYSGGGAPLVQGAAGPISGHTWGGSGNAQGNYNGGRVAPSYHGYFYIKYDGQAPNVYTFTINPTPSDATVQLTANGTTYNQSSITVVSGTTVSWSVSKSGYTTETGSNTITQDTTESVTLTENPVLYYCYREYIYSTWIYFYIQTKPTTDGTYTIYSANGQQVSSSSQFTVTSTVTFTNVTEDTLYYGGEIVYYYPDGNLYT